MHKLIRRSLVFLFILLLLICFAAIYFNLSEKEQTVYGTNQENEDENGDVNNMPKASGDLTYRDYDGEIVNIEDTATIYVTMPREEKTDDIVIVLVNCNTGKRLEQNDADKVSFENIEYGTYAIAAYYIDGDQYKKADIGIIVEIIYDIKEDGKKESFDSDSQKFS